MDKTMKTHNFKESYDAPIVLCLGFFDCIHIGHKSLIEDAIRISKRMKCQSALLTFANDPNTVFGKLPQIYTIVERAMVIRDLGIDNLICADFDSKFSAMSAKCFLDTLTTNFNIQAVVAGRDYTFGHGGEGDVDYLKAYAQENNFRVRIVPFERINDKKISTSNLKNMVSGGNVDELNHYLSAPYFISGTVIHAMHRGRIIGFPTANMSAHSDALALGCGVYATKTYINDKWYISMTSIGAKPTFDEDNYSIETYIIDYNGDIYGKDIVVEFYKKIRNLVKFPSVASLQKQLESDEAQIKKFFCTDKSDLLPKVNDTSIHNTGLNQSEQSSVSAQHISEV